VSKRYQVIRTRKQIEIAVFEAFTADAALGMACLQGKGGTSEFRSIIPLSDEWSYEVSPVSTNQPNER
jgi:hypothetical protein